MVLEYGPDSSLFTARLMAPPCSESDIYLQNLSYDGDTTWHCHHDPSPCYTHSHCDSAPCPSHRHRAHGICGHTHRSPREGITHIKSLLTAYDPTLCRPCADMGRGGADESAGGRGIDARRPPFFRARTQGVWRAWSVVCQMRHGHAIIRFQTSSQTPRIAAMHALIAHCHSNCHMHCQLREHCQGCSRSQEIGEAQMEAIRPGLERPCS